MKKILLLCLLNFQLFYSQKDTSSIIAVKVNETPKVVKTWAYINVNDTIQYPFLNKTEETINSFLNDPILKKAHWGFCLYSPKTNKVLVNKGINESYLPASTTKIISSEAVLHYLGENFRWKTQFLYTGEVNSLGILQGDLYVVYNGDPTIGLNKINAKSYLDITNEVFYALQKKGIKAIEGNIIAESVVFKKDKRFYEIDNNYMNFGDFYSVIPSKENNLVTINDEIEPKEISSIEKEDLASINAENDIEEQIINDIINDLENNIRMFKLESIALKNSILHNPPSFLSTKIKKYLAQKGFKIYGKVVTQDYKNLQLNKKRKLLFNYDSPPLKDLVFFTLQNSNNIYADHLLRTIGYMIGKEDSRSQSLKTIKNHLKKVNFDFNRFSIVDGSGLSRSNWITPFSQVKFLSYILKQPYFKTFYHALPSAGENGTLRNMFVYSPLKGNVHAKTGTLNAVKTLAGYVDLPNGERLAFSLLINSYSGSPSGVKNRMEKLLETVLY